MSALLVLTDAYKFYFCCTKVDMRKSIVGSAGKVFYPDGRAKQPVVLIGAAGRNVVILR
jgi:hypothetical protein